MLTALISELGRAMRGKRAIDFGVALVAGFFLSTCLEASESGVQIEAVNGVAASAPVRGDFSGAMDELAGRLQATAVRYALAAERFTDVERRYHAITGRMQIYLARERALMMDRTTPASVARVQLANAVSDGDLASSEIQTQVKGFAADFEDATTPITKELDVANAHCRNLDEQGEAAKITQEKASCARLADAARAYSPLLSRVSHGLEHLDRVYADEHRAQESLIAEATLIQ